ncbi:hypothetical protein [Shewanella surugensis]|uniref:Lipoprotein n=1 Tax=Shewanella surugensis TaxID=212020 RepID=A0ABT0LIK7_9GAMM|nr:hypothetical protein [Shewanella surugensis]MCL1127538.1 hypothetical protein [Shewanella surugensis]
MRTQWLGITLILFFIMGCSSTPEYGSVKVSAPYIGAGNVDYESLYHYGYYRGCQNAVATKEGNVELINAFSKDTALDGLSKFDNGWNAGNKICQDGVSHSMYRLESSTSGS